jgi:hypothetical protein
MKINSKNKNSKVIVVIIFTSIIHAIILGYCIIFGSLERPIRIALTLLLITVFFNITIAIKNRKQIQEPV